MIISLDCETVGLDIYHGSAKPFLVTTMTEKEELTFWEWDVCPITREPEIPKKDLLEIRDVIQDADELVLQNGIYDGSVLIWYFDYRGIPFYWDWSKVRDPLYAGHLLASNEPHDLTTLGIRCLGYNIEKYEKDLETAVKACRRLTANREFIERNGEWKIAKAGYPDMPSIKEKSWQADFWLPRAVAKTEKYPKNDPHWTVTSSYANVDSSVTLPIWKVQEQEIKERDLWEIYLERLKLLPIVFDMQSRGVTINQRRAQELIDGFREDSEHSGLICTSIAESYDYELHLPKSGNNKSLTEFIPKIVPKEVYNRMPLTEGNNPSLNKTALEFLTESLPPRSKALTFFQELRAKRKKDTGISYLEGYERFWVPLIGGGESDESFYWRLLHPRLNPTGQVTLRWSSSAPNEQNISKQEDANLRYAFGPAPGREWWSLDAKNIELRIPAYESGEKDLIDLFERADEPPYYGSEHILNFSVVYPDIWEAAVKKVGIEKAGPYVKKFYASTYYQWCKNGDFAVGYGAIDRPEGTADKAFHRVGSHARLKERFAKKEILNQYYIKQAEKYGYVETLPDRTVNPKRGYPLLCTRTKWGGVKPTVPLNYHVQSTAMWVMARMMVKVKKYLDQLSRKTGEVYRIVLQIHDEVVVDLPQKPDKENLGIVLEIKKLMDSIGDDLIPAIPLPVGIEYHPHNWKDGEQIL